MHSRYTICINETTDNSLKMYQAKIIGSMYHKLHKSYIINSKNNYIYQL